MAYYTAVKDGKKQCRRCKQWLPVTEFNRKYEGYQHNCRRCSKVRQWEIKYKITEDQYNSLLEAQAGVCAICSQPETVWGQLSVDHDHSTGKVRGLLCHKCNPMIGYARENQDILLSAVNYLKEHHG